MFKRISLILALSLLIALSGCGPVPQTTQANQVRDTKLHLVTMKLTEEPENYPTELIGSMRHGTIGDFSQDNNQIIRGEVLEVNPPVDFVSKGDINIITANDLKVMALKAGEIASFVCTRDLQQICEYESGPTRLGCYDIYHFNECKLVELKPNQ